MRKRVLAGAALALATALFVASCGGESIAPKANGETKGEIQQPSTTPSSAPSSAAPDPKFPDKEVTAAALGWLNASNEARKTLDPAPMLELSASNCDNCNRFATHMRQTKQNGGHNSGDYREEPQGVTAPKITGGTATLTVTIKRGDWSYVSKAGAKPQKYKADKYEIKFGLSREDGKWLVTEAVAYV